MEGVNAPRSPCSETVIGGAILAVDGAEGVDAPALFTAAQALKKGIPVIPVLLRSRGSCQSAADVAADLEKVLGLKVPETGNFLECSRHAASRKDFEATFLPMCVHCHVGSNRTREE